jgi:hypothetical protein
MTQRTKQGQCRIVDCSLSLARAVHAAGGSLSNELLNMPLKEAIGILGLNMIVFTYAGPGTSPEQSDEAQADASMAPDGPAQPTQLPQLNTPASMTVLGRRVVWNTDDAGPSLGDSPGRMEAEARVKGPGTSHQEHS